MSVRTLSNALVVARGPGGAPSASQFPGLRRLAAELEKSRDEAGSRSAVVRCL